MDLLLVSEALFMTKRSWSSVALAALLGTACGYTVGAAKSARSFRVAPLREPGLDTDAGALVLRSVRQTLARGPSTRLASGSEAVPELTVELISSDASLAPFSDPGLRAAQYLAVVRIRGTLTSSTGRQMWRSGVVSAEEPYFTVADDLEALDGARRSALSRAATRAAEDLVSSLVYGPR